MMRHLSRYSKRSSPRKERSRSKGFNKWKCKYGKVQTIGKEASTDEGYEAEQEGSGMGNAENQQEIPQTSETEDVAQEQTEKVG